MCGIAGWSTEPGANPPPRALAAMSGAMAHRGPDGEGEFRDDGRGIALAHRRLSILDLSEAGAQPMQDQSGGILVYNGELHDFRELRSDLEAEGHRFRWTGDAEVVLKALVARGRAALERFAGMFALAYVPPGASRVLLARGGVTDRLDLRREVEAYLVQGRPGPPLPSPFGVLRRLVWRLLVFQLWSQRLGLAL